MTIDDGQIPPKVARSILEDFPLPKRRFARNDSDDLMLAREAKAEQLLIARDHVAQLEHEYAALMATEVDFDPDPSTRERPAGIDPRCFDLGTDVTEQFRPREERPVINIETSRV